MAVEPIFYGATLRDRLIAAATRDDEGAAVRLDALLHGENEDPIAQREEAWTALSVAIHWAARALKTVGVVEAQRLDARGSASALVAAAHRRIVKAAAVDIAEHEVLGTREVLAAADTLKCGGGLVGEGHDPNAPGLRGRFDASAARAVELQH